MKHIPKNILKNIIHNSGVSGKMILPVSAASAIFLCRAAIKRCMAELIIQLSLLLIAQNCISFRDFLELLLCLGISGIRIRVILLCQPAVRLFNSSVICIPAYASISL